MVQEGLPPAPSVKWASSTPSFAGWDTADASRVPISAQQAFYPPPGARVVDLRGWRPSRSPPPPAALRLGEAVFSHDARTAPEDLPLWVFEMDHTPLKLPSLKDVSRANGRYQSAIHPAAPSHRYPPWAVIVWAVYQSIWETKHAWDEVAQFAITGDAEEEWPTGELSQIMMAIDCLPAFHRDLISYARKIMSQLSINDEVLHEALQHLRVQIRKSPQAKSIVIADTQFAPDRAGVRKDSALAHVFCDLADPTQSTILVPWHDEEGHHWAAVRFQVASRKYAILDSLRSRGRPSPRIEKPVRRTGRAIDKHLKRKSTPWELDDQAPSVATQRDDFSCGSAVFNSLQLFIAPETLPWSPERAKYHRAKMLMAVVDVWKENGRPIVARGQRHIAVDGAAAPSSSGSEVVLMAGPMRALARRPSTDASNTSSGSCVEEESGAKAAHPATATAPAPSFNSSVIRMQDIPWGALLAPKTPGGTWTTATAPAASARSNADPQPTGMPGSGTRAGVPAPIGSSGTALPIKARFASLAAFLRQRRASEAGREGLAPLPPSPSAGSTQSAAEDEGQSMETGAGSPLEGHISTPSLPGERASSFLRGLSAH
ncbi:uncharacterized protein BXZ73DRAFT_83586 [Epithele typhae]|uniref:uncharacterized protein n=1 Tax=Epithele typhae TaxID=378194 RepID=UPI0020086CA7|nr:uncharacterized protein BXZ73DRAFT_83586 [Epithele typhae]KAH9910424.1 hypothetical protein BXZ73DRAFT_83586 [Epithele typhae]